MENVIDIVCDEGVRSRIVIGSAQEEFAGLLPEQVSRVIIITDAKVHVNNLAFINAYDHIVIGQGESSKTFVKIEEVYRQLLPRCERVVVTRNHCVRSCDTRFPDLDTDPAWHVEEVREGGVTPEGVAFDFVTYVRA